MSPEDLKGEQPLSQRSWPGITLILLYWVKQDLLMRVCWGKLELATPFFWWWKTAGEDRLHGVELTIRTCLMKGTIPVRIKCLMKLHFPLNRTHHITIISAYAPHPHQSRWSQRAVLQRPQAPNKGNIPQWQAHNLGGFQCQTWQSQQWLKRSSRPSWCGKSEWQWSAPT